MTDYEDAEYRVEGTTAVITMNRPHRYNALRGRTVDELIHAFRAAWADRGVQAVILTGAGDKSLCTGGDVKQRAETGDYGPTESGMGLVNAVVPADRLLDEAMAWAAEVAQKSPTAIRFLKQSFNADTDHLAGLSNMAMSALDLFVASPEGLEGAAAFAEKRTPDFASKVIGPKHVPGN